MKQITFLSDQKCWTITNQSFPSEYRQIMRNSISFTYIGFRRCTKININIDSLRSVRPSLFPFYSQNFLHILSKSSRGTARQPSQGVGSIGCGSSRIQKNYYIILNLLISTLSQTRTSIFRPFTQPFLTKN